MSNIAYSGDGLHEATHLASGRARTLTDSEHPLRPVERTRTRLMPEGNPFSHNFTARYSRDGIGLRALLDYRLMLHIEATLHNFTARYSRDSIGLRAMLDHRLMLHLEATLRDHSAEDQRTARRRSNQCCTYASTESEQRPFPMVAGVAPGQHTRKSTSRSHPPHVVDRIGRHGAVTSCYSSSRIL